MFIQTLSVNRLVMTLRCNLFAITLGTAMLGLACLTVQPAGAEMAAATQEDAVATVELVMVEQAGCVWCARWNDEVAPIYPHSAEGQVAPLRRIDKHQPVPDDLVLAASLIFTPTFILTVDGREVRRIEGYAGEDFFWGMLDAMMTDAGLAHTADGETADGETAGGETAGDETADGG